MITWGRDSVVVILSLYLPNLHPITSSKIHNIKDKEEVLCLCMLIHYYDVAAASLKITLEIMFKL